MFKIFKTKKDLLVFYIASYRSIRFTITVSLSVFLAFMVYMTVTGGFMKAPVFILVGISAFLIFLTPAKSGMFEDDLLPALREHFKYKDESRRKYDLIFQLLLILVLIWWFSSQLPYLLFYIIIMVGVRLLSLLVWYIIVRYRLTHP